ncbi:MAG TPA: PASTA domain-containing protein [Solirubrobacteraceae bacterium]|nr:PASTA domain-containing protein [Solirubrobacteraceae bacterium]
MAGSTVAIQCVASMAGTLIGEALGSTLPAKLVVGCLGALIGAFLTAPGRNRRRRIVAVAILIALIHLFRRAGDALASERRGWVPANWAVVGLAAAVGFAGGSAVTTVRGGWDTTSSVSVPQVRGENRAAAITILENAGLSPTPATEPSESIPEGSATRTDPAGGATVDDGAQVTLFVSSGPPGATVKVPDVTGSDRDDARSILRDAGLRSRVRRESSQTIAADHATRTTPPAGTPVDRGARVTLLISTGPATQSVEIPDVRGQRGAQAQATLTDAGLAPRMQTEPSDDIAEGAATRTDPAAGTKVERGAEVTVFVSEGPVAGQVTVPNVANADRAKAFAALENAGLKPEGASEPSDSIAEGAATRTDPVAGTVVDAGSTVTVFISSGPPPLLVPQVVGLGVGDAQDTVETAGLKWSTTRATSTDVPAGDVMDSNPDGGQEIEPGGTVELIVSCGSSCID